MKNTSSKAVEQLFFKIALLPFFILFIGNSLSAQLAVYPLRTAHSTNNNTPQGDPQASLTSVNVNAQTLIGGTSMDLNNYNSQGYRLRTNVSGSTVAWPTVATDGFGFDIPISPVAGNDIHFTGISVRDTAQSFSSGSTNFYIEPFYQVDGGAWVRINGASTVTVTSTTSPSGYNFGPVNETFYSGHTYVIRFYVYASSGSNKSDNFRIRYLTFDGITTAPPAVAPTVTTTSASGTGFYSANAVGSYQSGAGFHTVYQSGFVWSTAANPTYPASSYNSDGTGGSINSAITGLTAGTLYHIRSYIITQFGIFYGADISFNTSAPAIPTITTNAVTSILSNKATSGGSSIDSSGAIISEKGLIWSTSPNPLVSTYPGGNKGIYPTGGSLSFSDIMKPLLPNTTYYMRAYAINSVGVGYGNVIQFTTAAPAPVLTAIPGVLDLGENLGGSNPIVLNYALTGSLLTPASGNITITAQAPFLVSLTGAANSFTSSVVVAYNNSTVLSTPIYVELPTNNLGSYTGYITQAGGGVSAANADTVFVSGSVVQSPDDITNQGTDFWLGFGYEEKMSQKSGASGEAKLSVYISAGDQPASVIVELPGIPGAPTFPRAVNIPANTVAEVTGFPTGDPNNNYNGGHFPDSRLFYTGVSDRGIHVYSTNGAAVSVWMYTYADNNSAAGSMVFPTSTWNSSYTVQAYGGKSNVGGAPNSFFYVIANENNTEVIFTPTQPIVDSNSNTIFNDGHSAADIKYAAGVADTVVLNKGQVFNAMGYVQGSGSNSALGLDLSGTTVRTSCDKKIAVFGGNGRCLISTPVLCSNPTSGSDNLVQQMIPQVAWGTKYFTVPTKSMEYNLYRIYVQDPTTQVWVNNPTHTTPLTGIVNNLYYVRETNQPLLIESDKPISVTQFVTAGDCASNGGSSTIGNNGYGDPEMIILSAAQQAINKVAVYSPNFRNGSSGASYLNVVIKTGGVSSFRLDPTLNPTQMVDTGSSSYTGTTYGSATLIPIANAFKPYTSDGTYSWARFKVSTGATHKMQSDSGFNAIAYGMSNGESYGFNAGTAVKNLNSVKLAVNPNGQDSSSAAVRTCINNPVKLRIALPYNPFLVDSLVWYPENALDPRITPNTRNKGAIDVGTNKAYYVRSYMIDGRTFYEYESPVTYQFKALGTYRIVANAYGTFASDCPGEDRQKIPVIVGRDNINFTYTALCGNPTVTFSNNTLPMAGGTIDSLLWEFGDGGTSTSTAATVTHTFVPPPTLFMVKLSTVNTFGCNSSDSVLVDISGGIRPKFSITPKDTICTGSSVTFDPSASTVTGTTTGTPVKWTWNYGEGADVVVNGASSPNQSHQYNNAGVFPVTLTLETSSGCQGIFKDTVVVEATPVAAINANPTVVCLGDSAAYMDASTIAIGTITGWLWSFDDGTTSTLQNPKHKWTTDGVHTVTLTVSSAGGCPAAASATHSINVNPLPTPGFRYDLNCTTRTMTVTDTSNGYGTAITGWDWDFGDGGTSTLQNPSHVYAASGTYTVTLSVTTANGCRSAAPVSITVTIAASPVADFTIPGNTCLPGASPAFNNTTTISDGTIAQVTYTWNFGDGTGDFNSPPTPASPTHVFAGTGPYTISLTAISNNGCTNTVTKPYASIFAPPVAAIAALSEVCVNGTVNFSSASSTAPGSTVTGWLWDFGDGSATDNTQNPSHTYTTAGVKTVQLTVFSAAGCSSKTDTAYLTVNDLPVGNFTDTVNCTTRSVGFTDISVAGSGTLNQWNWNFGAGEGTSTLQNPTHVFTTEGNHTVTLSVTNDKGCTSSTAFSQNVFINSRPVADFALPGNVCLPAGSASFTNATSISDGSLTSVGYTWSFGDGGTANSSNPTHAYTAVGPFTVVLTATSNAGCINSVTKTYNGVYDQPVAVITAPSGVCLGNAASFSAASSTAPASSVTGWQWDFGDTPSPGSSALQSPAYTYTGSGPRTVSLTVTSAVGCVSAQATTNINVNLSPVAAFTYPATRCKDSVITFTDASVSNAAGGITEWNWDFGGSGTLTQTTAGPVAHTFNNAQVYNVSLSVKNANGCVSSSAYTTPVVINPNPVSAFNVSSVCIPSGQATFTQQASISSGQNAGWSWNFGDAGATGSGQTATHIYATGGTYQVTLRVTSDSGCTASLTSPVSAYNSPTALFNVTNATALCSNLPVSIVNQSVVSGFGTVDKIDLFWDYANSPTVKTTISQPALNDTYNNQYPVFGNQPSKTYQVLIRAYSGNGCTTDYSQNISLLAAPKAQFTIPAPVCQEAASFSLTGGSDAFGLPGTGIYSGAGVVSSPVFSPSSAGAGTYPIRFTYTTTNGCSDYVEQNIVVNPTPVISFSRSTYNVLEGDALQLSPSITNGNTYLWAPANYLSNASVAAPVAIPTADITYTLTVTSAYGCEASQSVDVKVVRKYVVPNTFTPNNDGNHDRWEIENLSLYPDVRVRVFSRTGQLVFESYGYNTPWDGKFKGQDCPFGTYYYVIETGGGRNPKTGYVTIVR